LFLIFCVFFSLFFGSLSACIGKSARSSFSAQSFRSLLLFLPCCSSCIAVQSPNRVVAHIGYCLSF
jgi:hypothetical protein